METNDALELVFARNMFYRRLHFLALGAFAISLVVIGILISTIIYIKRTPYHPYYFAADNVSRLLQIIPVNTPNMTNDQVMKWTIKAVQGAFTFDYINYHKQLQNAQKYFTPYGWSQYMNALTSSNNLVGVIQRKMVSLAQVFGQPKLLVQGILAGAYAWQFQLPLLVTYTSTTDNVSYANPLIITVIVQRQPALEGNAGLGIVQMIAAEANLPSNNGPQEISNSPSG